MLSPIPIAIPGGQLPSSTTVLYTVGLAGPVRLESIVLVNTDSSSRTVNLYITRANASTTQRVTPKNCSLSAGSMYETGPFNLFSGDAVKGDASIAAVVDYTLTGMQYL